MAESVLYTVEDYVAVRFPTNDSPLVPTADEVYSYAFQGTRTLQGHEITGVVPSDLSFSRFPVDLRIQVKVVKDSFRAQICCEVVAKGVQDSAVVRNVLGRTADHIVISGTWYPFVPGALRRVRDVLVRVDVGDSDHLTLGDYLALSRPEYRDCVEDCTHHDLDAVSRASTLQGSPPPGLRADLYAYQLAGYNWLRTLCADDIGCILADEMGLGKTLQVIALLLQQRDLTKSPSVVVVPATLIENWNRELRRFAPSLNVYTHQGTGRTGFPTRFLGFDIVLMSYDTLVRDIAIVKMVTWNILVADEAQAIKNPDAKRTLMVKMVPRRATVAVTGTPLENSLRDLWSITDFVLPGLLGKVSEFEARYADSVENAARIEPLITPILLRRKVAEVAKDLPPRIDIPQPVELGPELAPIYENMRLALANEYGDSCTLVALGKLRQFCIHPFQVTGAWGDPASGNNKYLRFLEILEEIFANGEKALVFLQYHHATDLFCQDLKSRFGVPVDWIDGRVPVPDRQNKVDRFTEVSGSAVLLLNPRAAGTGLNLAAANHVIHFGPDWNPAVEDQASARAYRRGQTLPVTIHQLFFVNTVEDVIIERLDFKRNLARSAVVGADDDSRSRHDVMRALQASPLERGDSEDGS